MSSSPLSERLSDFCRLRRKALRRNLPAKEREELLERLIAEDEWLACLSPESAARYLGREIRSEAAKRWLLSLVFEGEGAICELARREIGKLRAFEDPAGAGGARLLSPLTRSLERFLSEYERRRGRSVAKWFLGFGEVSTSLALKGNETLLHEHEGRVWGRRVYKRMPVFPSRVDAERYRKIYFEYDRLLRREVGLSLPPTGVQILERGRAGVAVFVWQLQLPPQNIGPVVLRRLSVKQAIGLFDSVMDNLRLLFRANERLGREGVRIGLDGQITNWAVRDPQEGQERPDLLFLDTNTPLIRKNGREVLDTEIFLHALSPMLRPVVRRFFLQKILDRYYDPRTIILDFLGNTIVQGRPDLVGPFVERLEERRTGDLEPYGIAPIGEAQVERYFREDVFTWRLVRTAKALQEAASEAASARLADAWGKLKQVKKIWTSELFDVSDRHLEEAVER